MIGPGDVAIMVVAHIRHHDDPRFGLDIAHKFMAYFDTASSGHTAYSINYLRAFPGVGPPCPAGPTKVASSLVILIQLQD